MNKPKKTNAISYSEAPWEYEETAPAWVRDLLRQREIAAKEAEAEVEAEVEADVPEDDVPEDDVPEPEYRWVKYGRGWTHCELLETYVSEDRRNRGQTIYVVHYKGRELKRTEAHLERPRK